MHTCGRSPQRSQGFGPVPDTADGLCPQGAGSPPARALSFDPKAALATADQPREPSLPDAPPRGRLPPSPWLAGGALPASSLPNPRGHRHRSWPRARFVQPPHGARPGWSLILCTQSVDVKHRSPSRPCVRWVGAALSHRRVRPPGCRSPNRGADTQAQGQVHSVSLEKPLAQQAGTAAHPSSGPGASPGFLPWLFAERPLSPGVLGSAWGPAACSLPCPLLSELQQSLSVLSDPSPPVTTPSCICSSLLPARPPLHLQKTPVCPQNPLLLPLPVPSLKAGCPVCPQLYRADPGRLGHSPRSPPPPACAPDHGVCSSAPGPSSH